MVYMRKAVTSVYMRKTVTSATIGIHTDRLSSRGDEDTLILVFRQLSGSYVTDIVTLSRRLQSAVSADDTEIDGVDETRGHQPARSVDGPRPRRGRFGGCDLRFQYGFGKSPLVGANADLRRHLRVCQEARLARELIPLTLGVEGLLGQKEGLSLIFIV